MLTGDVKWEDVGFVNSDVAWIVVGTPDGGPGVRRGGNGGGDRGGWKSGSEEDKMAGPD